jgi:hypothetical protein
VISLAAGVADEVVSELLLLIDRFLDAADAWRIDVASMRRSSADWNKLMGGTSNCNVELQLRKRRKQRAAFVIHGIVIITIHRDNDQQTR